VTGAGTEQVKPALVSIRRLNLTLGNLQAAGLYLGGGERAAAAMAAGCDAWSWTAARALESAEAFEVSPISGLDGLSTYKWKKK
jgi:hypothetical protein